MNWPSLSSSSVLNQSLTSCCFRPSTAWLKRARTPCTAGLYRKRPEWSPQSSEGMAPERVLSPAKRRRSWAMLTATRTTEKKNDFDGPTESYVFTTSRRALALEHPGTNQFRVWFHTRQANHLRRFRRPRTRKPQYTPRCCWRIFFGSCGCGRVIPAKSPVGAA